MYCGYNTHARWPQYNTAEGSGRAAFRFRMGVRGAEMQEGV